MSEPTEPTESFPAPDLEDEEQQEGSDQTAGSTGADVPRVHAEDPAEGADDESATS